MNFEDQVATLKLEKQRLLKELAECKADKEFVWLLWKQLQSRSPDVTSAIGMVVTREKEKSEKKNKKVLEILQTKDARINQLETSLLETTEKLRDVQEELQTFHADHQVELVHFKSEIHSYTTQMKETKETIKKLEDELSHQRNEYADKFQSKEHEIETLRENETELTAQLTKANEECRSLSLLLEKERTSISQELQSVNQCRSDLQDKCHQLEDENRQLQQQCQQSSEKMKGLTETVKTLRLEDKQKSSQVCTLQSLVADAEKTSNENRIALEVEKELHQKKLDKTVKETQVAYEELQQILLETQKRHAKELAEKSFENAELKSQLIDRHGVTRETQTSGYQLKDSTTSPLKLSHLVTQSSKSSINTTTDFHLEKSMTEMQLELENTKETLRVKTHELRELKSAHVNRLRRMQDLQMNYKLVLEQLKTYDEEAAAQSAQCLNPKPIPVPRASIKELQQEDSDTVWNELRYYRSQNENLKSERVALEEECDVLQVQVAEHLTTIHDLRNCLEAEKDELVAKLQYFGASKDVDASLNYERDCRQLAERDAEAFQKSILQLEEDKQRLLTAKWQQHEECFHLREQVAKLKAQLLHSQLDACHVAVQCSVIKSNKMTVTDVRGLDKAVVSLQHVDTQTDKEVQTDSFVPLSDGQHERIVTDNHAESNKLSKSVGTLTSSIQWQDKQTQTDTTAGHPASQRNKRKLHFHSKSAGTVFAFGSHYVSQRHAKSRGRTRGLKSEDWHRMLQQRIASLTRQLSVVQKAKEDVVDQLNEQQQQYQQLEKDHQYGAHHVYTIQVLQSELEAQRNEKAQLEQRLSEALLVRAEQMATASVSNSSLSHRNESEWKQLEHRAKSSSEECVRQGRFIKSLKSELQTQEEQTKGLREKCVHLERDVTRKQGLIEEMRSRLKIAQDDVESYAKKLKSAEDRCENAEDAHEQRKSRLQALKGRLSHETEEREKLQISYHNIQAELDKKAHECQQLKGRLRRSETIVAQMVEKMKKSEQLKEETHRKALTSVQKKLVHAAQQVEEYKAFVKAFTQELIQQVREARQLSRALEEKTTTKQAPVDVSAVESSRSWARAKQISCSILNITDAEFAEFMHLPEQSAANSGSDFHQADDQTLREKETAWWKQAVKLANSQPPFAVALMELFLSIIDVKLQFLTSNPQKL
ncbi:centlein-like isoform X2 [Corticium candelabrum]|uniref:centlein-like isoform X2 n=1 Tax=Corticium candelabrum TaxID=121492 RepID=UPI002E25A0A7|nr:centlein-like isoform X2 [Corticium candelabrum]